MNRNPDSFATSYAFGFRRYLANPTETLLRAAYELGRQAVERELGVLDLAATHHEALRAVLGKSPAPRDLEDIVLAAEAFFLESLGAFEMVQRGFHEAREAAAEEKRQAAIIRRLSSVLADTALALDTSDSLEEMLRFVAEQARELTEARICVVTMMASGDDASVEAVARTDADRSWGPELAWRELATLPNESSRHPGDERDQPQDRVQGGREHLTHSLSAPLTSLDGHVLGRIQIVEKVARRGFSEVDNAVLVHLAQMISAAVERAWFHQRHEGGRA